ncbi:fructosamine kinase family protein [Actibacterium sp. MT2.3-13A]|uniref:fructosamine kinase family protein n=1 Tax=Actibacterium sp. MT2.3-13A TaxID=2828332 RepID=UPI001BAB4220|nr:fructosamine kinase family protein [Actibacterium sp. MT2.3-13A]
MTAGRIAEEGARLLGEGLAGWRALAGGDLSRVVRARLSSGREAIFKTGPAPRVEAEMLRAIRAAGVPAPEVLGASARVLALEALADAGGLRGAGWEALGAAVRRLHGATGAGYGWPEDYAFGAVAIRNAPCDDWPGFWAERRLLTEAGALPPEFSRRLERLARALPERLPARPAPALLHGDLWAGNVLAAPGGGLSGLIDPASSYGHGEVDLAMLHLFGSPGTGFAAGYGAADPGVAERRPIYQLWPAIVHVRLFGAGYLGLLDRLLGDCGV